MEIKEKVLHSKEELQAAMDWGFEHGQTYYENGEKITLPDTSKYDYLSAMNEDALRNDKVLGLDTLSKEVAPVVRKMTHDGWTVLSREYQIRNFHFFDDVPPHWPMSEGYKEDPADRLSEVSTMIVLQNPEKTRYAVITDTYDKHPGIFMLSIGNVERMFNVSRNVKKSKFDKEEIIRLRKLGKTYAEIEAEVGCHQSFAVRVCQQANIISGTLSMKDKKIKIAMDDGRFFECKKPGKLSVKTNEGWKTACIIWDADIAGNRTGMTMVWDVSDRLTGDISGSEVIFQGDYKKCPVCDGEKKIMNSSWEAEFDRLCDNGALSPDECEVRANRHHQKYVDCPRCNGVGYVAE